MKHEQIDNPRLCVQIAYFQLGFNKLRRYGKGIDAVAWVCKHLYRIFKINDFKTL